MSSAQIPPMAFHPLSYGAKLLPELCAPLTHLLGLIAIPPVHSIPATLTSSIQSTPNIRAFAQAILFVRESVATLTQICIKMSPNQRAFSDHLIFLPHSYHQLFPALFFHFPIKM
jgi:hypothetical protein